MGRSEAAQQRAMLHHSSAVGCISLGRPLVMGITYLLGLGGLRRPRVLPGWGPSVMTPGGVLGQAKLSAEIRCLGCEDAGDNNPMPPHCLAGNLGNPGHRCVCITVMVGADSKRWQVSLIVFRLRQHCWS